MGTRIHQRGFVLPFAVPTWAIYAVVLAAALGALWYAYTTIDDRGYTRGKAETEAAFVKRDNKALQDALTKVAALEADRRARESAHEQALQQIRDQHRKDEDHAKRQRDADVAAAIAGTLKLRDPGAAVRAAQCDRGAGPAPGSAAGLGDGAAGGELSGAAAEFLLQLVHDADRNTRQLGEAQRVIEAQRRTCNGIQ